MREINSKKSKNSFEKKININTDEDQDGMRYHPPVTSTLKRGESDRQVFDGTAERRFNPRNTRWFCISPEPVFPQNIFFRLSGPFTGCSTQVSLESIKIPSLTPFEQRVWGNAEMTLTRARSPEAPWWNLVLVSEEEKTPQYWWNHASESGRHEMQVG